MADFEQTEEPPPAEPAPAVAEEPAAEEPAPAASPAGGRGGGRGRGRGVGRGRSGRGGAVASKRASNAFMEEDHSVGQRPSVTEEEEEQKKRMRARTHECVTHLHSDPQYVTTEAPPPLEKKESKKFLRDTRKAMSKLTGMSGVMSKKTPTA